MPDSWTKVIIGQHMDNNFKQGWQMFCHLLKAEFVQSSEIND
jgi:hypothetical protein